MEKIQVIAFEVESLSTWLVALAVNGRVVAQFTPIDALEVANGLLHGGLKNRTDVEIGVGIVYSHVGEAARVQAANHLQKMAALAMQNSGRLEVRQEVLQ